MLRHGEILRERRRRTITWCKLLLLLNNNNNNNHIPRIGYGGGPAVLTRNFPDGGCRTLTTSVNEPAAAAKQRLSLARDIIIIRTRYYHHCTRIGVLQMLPPLLLPSTSTAFIILRSTGRTDGRPCTDVRQK